VIAAITSCTNTFESFSDGGGGILAKKAVEKGLTVPPWVKTSLAPGSRVVTDYYTKAGLLPYLEKLRSMWWGMAVRLASGLGAAADGCVEEHR